MANEQEVTLTLLTTTTDRLVPGDLVGTIFDEETGRFVEWKVVDQVRIRGEHAFLAFKTPRPLTPDPDQEFVVLRGLPI